MAHVVKRRAELVTQRQNLYSSFLACVTTSEHLLPSCWQHRELRHPNPVQESFSDTAPCQPPCRCPQQRAERTLYRLRIQRAIARTRSLVHSLQSPKVLRARCHVLRAYIRRDLVSPEVG